MYVYIYIYIYILFLELQQVGRLLILSCKPAVDHPRFGYRLSSKRRAYFNTFDTHGGSAPYLRYTPTLGKVGTCSVDKTCCMQLATHNGIGSFRHRGRHPRYTTRSGSSYSMMKAGVVSITHYIKEGKPEPTRVECILTHRILVFSLDCVSH